MSVSSLKVPKKLLHINETAYTDNWSIETYSYFHLFDRTINLVAPRQGSLGTNDLANWKNKAVSLAYNIKNKGLIEGRKEMVRIANEEYGLTVPGRVSLDNKCKDIDDILCVLGDREWYYSDIVYSRNVIYHLLYLISRPGYNSWLINAEKVWMEKYEVSYETSELNSNSKSNIKGFVYTIMNSTYANTTQKAFRKKLLFMYQEFITVRYRKKFTVSHDFDFTPYIFKNTYKGYIVTPKKKTSSFKTLPDVFRAGKDWIKDCKALKLYLAKINLLVERFYKKETMIINAGEQTHKNDNEQQKAMSGNVHEIDVSDNDESGKRCQVIDDFLSNIIQNNNIFALHFFFTM